MKILVIYDSFFGNTEQIARAIGDALGSPDDVGLIRVNDVRPEHMTGLDLLIVGSPTRAFRPTPAITRLLKRIPKDGLGGVRVAAFDTRIAVTDVKPRILGFLVRLFGYAANPILGLLKKKGGQAVLPPEGFLVGGTEGPLKEGELERARDWARQALATR
jgi:flavodoxin